MIGALNSIGITNGTITSLGITILLCGISIYAGRRLQTVPSGLQNFIEWAIGSLNDFFTDIMGEKAAKYGMTVETFDWLAPIHVPKEGEFINGLMEAYQEVTGDMVSEPQISGGATYARAFDGCVAYGACFPDTLLTEHEPNERVTIAELIKAAEVFKKAFEKLVIEK